MRALEELVKEFSDSVIGQTEAMRVGDIKRGNQLAKERVQAWGELCSAGDEGRDALAVLLGDPSADIRAMAAAFLLRYKTKEAQRVLLDVAEGEGLAAFGASEALERWKEGDWHLDPV